MIIRPARVEDLPTIVEIYNDAILHTTATFDTEPRTLAQQQSWFAKHDARHPVLVAELDGEVVGWASLTEYSDRCAYSDTAENSLYIAASYRGRGIGRRLLAALLQAGAEAGLHTILARITQDNEISLRLHEAFGFRHVGIMREVGRKFDRLLDVHLMQKIYI